MALNGDKIRRNKQYPKLEILSPELKKDTVDCTKRGNWSSVWRIIALSNMLNIRIDTVYPSVNGTKHYAFKYMNTTSRPPFTDSDKGTITLTWTNTIESDRENVTNRGRPKKEWTPNHFVPRVNIQREIGRGSSTNITHSNDANKVQTK